MEGGVFGLKQEQRIYLYLSQLAPAILVWFTHELILIYILLICFYTIASLVYIKYISLEKELYPYTFNELSKLTFQIQKGLGLALSAFLLITVYGIIILKVGKVVPPTHIELGQWSKSHPYITLIVALLVPLFEQWYWRLYLPKTLQNTTQKKHLINFSYLLLHLALFHKYLSFWKTIPFLGTFWSLGNSMTHIKQKYGFASAVITHYGVTLAAFFLIAYLKWFNVTKI